MYIYKKEGGEKVRKKIQSVGAGAVSWESRGKYSTGDRIESGCPPGEGGGGGRDDTPESASATKLEGKIFGAVNKFLTSSPLVSKVKLFMVSPDLLSVCLLCRFSPISPRCKIIPTVLLRRKFFMRINCEYFFFKRTPKIPPSSYSCPLAQH